MTLTELAFGGCGLDLFGSKRDPMNIFFGEYDDCV